MATLLAFSAALASVYGASAASSPYASVTASQWAALNSSVDGRLATSVPIAQPCFDAYSGIVNSNTLAPNSEACSEVQSLWTVCTISAPILLPSANYTCPEYDIPGHAIRNV